MEKRRVVITGLGAVTPIGHTAPESWAAVRTGKCGVAPITRYNTENQKVKLAAEVKDWDPESVLDKKEAKRMARYTQLVMAAAKEAVADSGLDLANDDPCRRGVIVSSGIGGLDVTEGEHSKGLEKGFDRVSPFYIPMAISNMAAGLIAIAHNCKAMCTCPCHRLRRRHQRRGRRLPLCPGRLRRRDDLRRCRGRRHPPGHRRLHLHEGPLHRHRPGPCLHPL